MIMMEQPSLCVSAHDTVGPDYKMWMNITVPEGTSPATVAHQIAAANFAALATAKSPLRNIIFNTHGRVGKISIGGKGQTGIDSTTVGAFGILRPLNVGTIWVVSCHAAEGSEGQALCQTLARVAGTQVIAAEGSQEVGTYATYRLWFGLDGQIDDFEGTVYSFTPMGHVSKGIDPEEVVWTIKR
jgi:hypothetical protein